MNHRCGLTLVLPLTERQLQAHVSELPIGQEIEIAVIGKPILVSSSGCEIPGLPDSFASCHQLVFE